MTGARGSDKTFLSHCEKQLVDVKAFVGYGPKNPHLKKGQFGVIHYAGKVMYQSVGFLEKNSDAMTVNIEELIATSSVSHMSKLHQWSAAGGDAAAAATAGNSKSKSSGSSGSSKGSSRGGGHEKKKSVSGQFTSQLKTLMETIEQTSPSYVRCIKPNSIKKPNVLEAKLTLEQLRYAGVFQAVTIRQTGFPFRLNHREFCQRFRVLFPSIDMTPSSTGTPAQFQNEARNALAMLSKKFSTVMPSKSNDVGFEFEMEVGTTRVFYRAPTHRTIETARRKLLAVKALIIEKVYRGLSSRKLVNKLKISKKEILIAMEHGVTASEEHYLELSSAVEKAGELRVELRELKSARSRLSLLTKQRSCREELNQLIVPNLSRKKLEAMLARAVNLGMNEVCFIIILLFFFPLSYLSISLSVPINLFERWLTCLLCFFSLSLYLSSDSW